VIERVNPTGPTRQTITSGISGGLSGVAGHRRYLALPSTTPECDSFFAKQSCGAKRCLSHQVLASSAVGNRSFITVGPYPRMMDTGWSISQRAAA
jgi:hypothetical protein